MSHDITHWACFRLSRACMCTRRQMWLLLCWLEVNWFCRIFAGPNYSAKCLSCQPYSLSCANFHKILPTLLMYSFILLQRFCNHVFMIYTKHTRFVSWTSNKHLLLYTWYYLWPQKNWFPVPVCQVHELCKLYSACNHSASQVCTQWLHPHLASQRKLVRKAGRGLGTRLTCMYNLVCDTILFLYSQVTNRKLNLSGLTLW